MTITGATVASATVLGLQGPLTITADTRELHELVGAAVAGAKSRILLDLAEVPDLDCAGIGQLVLLREEVRGQGGSLALVHVGSRQLRALRLAGLLDVLLVFEEWQAALSWCTGRVHRRDLAFELSAVQGLGPWCRPAEDALLSTC